MSLNPFIQEKNQCLASKSLIYITTGSELLQDSESFLNELSEQEMAIVLGGRKKRTHLYYYFSTRSFNDVAGYQTV
ncbi:MAG: hypothetical protein ACREPR_24455 [Brasilonema sp.]